MKTTYQHICVNDWIKTSDSIYQVTGRKAYAGAILLCLDRDRPNGENFLYGFPNSEIERLSENQVANIAIEAGIDV